MTSKPDDDQDGSDGWRPAPWLRGRPAAMAARKRRAEKWAIEARADRNAGDEPGGQPGDSRADGSTQQTGLDSTDVDQK